MGSAANPGTICRTNEAYCASSDTIRPTGQVDLFSPSRSPQKLSRALQVIRALFRLLPNIAATACRPTFVLPRHYNKPHGDHVGGKARVTRTFYMHRRTHITLAIQEHPGNLPSLMLDLGVPIGKLMQEISIGGLRASTAISFVTAVFSSPTTAVARRLLLIRYRGSRSPYCRLGTVLYVSGQPVLGLGLQPKNGMAHRAVSCLG